MLLGMMTLGHVSTLHIITPALNTRSVCHDIAIITPVMENPGEGSHWVSNLIKSLIGKHHLLIWTMAFQYSLKPSAPFHMRCFSCQSESGQSPRFIEQFQNKFELVMTSHKREEQI